MTLGLWEDLQEQRVNDAVEWLERRYGYNIPEDKMWKAIEKFDVDYFSLPKWLADKFDKFNVI